MALFYGYNPPFIGGLEGILSRQEDQRLVENDILQLLLTLPGERVHEPDFGSRLRATVFEPLDDATLDLLRADIESLLAREESRITETEVFLERDDVKRELRVKITGVLDFDLNTVLAVELGLPLGGSS